MAQTDHIHAHPQDGHDKELVPRVLVFAVCAFVLIVLALVTWSRLSGQPVTYTPPTGAITHERTFNLSGDMSGRATVTALDGTLIAELNPKEGGFISGVWRVIQRERTKHRVALTGPLTLVRYDNGRIAIHDPSTGWNADLMGFGIDNAKAFARLLAQ
ncbi:MULTISPECIES: photosynthetic complex assembly protein PuhC [unclassified Roseovarius]|uniref:photosynthetic complex assembly protein PuhC n=1 Tax=unclassified Roseovarius TaxID=2614913 RepID=UPI00273DC3BD|nr:photosynthetic complex assembly protein PuhC [Roseovarius sp. MMSF_3350]